MTDQLEIGAIETKKKTPRLNRKNKLAIFWVAVVVGAAGLAILGSNFLINRGRVYSDKVKINAVIVDTVASGRLDEVKVKVGDLVKKDQVVGTVEKVPLKAKIDGLVVAVSDKVGEAVTPANPVVRIADLNDTWAEVLVDENKVAPIEVGERAWFTADAYPGERVQALVSEISPESAAGGILFNISDKRQTQQFVVKLRYDSASESKLRPGMSAKAWIETR